VNFTQTIAVRSDNPQALVDMLAEWDEQQAAADVMGYMGTHLLADRDRPGHYLIVAEASSTSSTAPGEPSLCDGLTGEWNASLERTDGQRTPVVS
jgi:hypothetical protein